METIIIIVGIVIAFFVGMLVIYKIQAKKISVKLSEEEFKKDMRKAQLIDVRSKREFDAGHINGARHFNMQAIAREYKNLRMDKPIYIYCSNGKRSQRAVMYLYAKGYQNLYVLENGLKSWSGPLK